MPLDHILSHICIHNPENTNDSNMYNLEFQQFKVFNCYDESEGNWRLKYVFDVTIFFVNTLPRMAAWCRNM